MLRKIALIFLCLSLFIGLCGCDLFTAETDELLSPPSLSGELKPIAEIISQTAGGEYTLKYPSRGNFRSAVIREDIDSDGLLEAFAFYYTTDGEVGYMNINTIAKKGNKWKSLSIQKIVAGGVDKVEFCDLDNDGIKEILVGWQIYGTSEMQLAVYSLINDSLTQRMLQRYTHFTTCNLNEDTIPEVFTILSASDEQSNTASVFQLQEKGVLEISSCLLDSASKTFLEPVVATLSSGKPAIYIDEIKGVGAITEILYLENNVLKNPLYSPDFKETLSTLRSVSLSTKDINGDSILEIPVQENVPSVAVSELNEILYLTNWCSFNGRKLTTQQTTMTNVNDGYSFTIPNRLIGKIAILKDTETHEREIFLYNQKTLSVGFNLISFKSVPLDELDDSLSGYTEVLRTDTTAHLYSLSLTAQKYGITDEYVKQNFNLFE